jgi:hypothetical protein
MAIGGGGRQRWRQIAGARQGGIGYVIRLEPTTGRRSRTHALILAAFQPPIPARLLDLRTLTIGPGAFAPGLILLELAQRLLGWSAGQAPIDLLQGGLEAGAENRQGHDRPHQQQRQTAAHQRAHAQRAPARHAPGQEVNEKRGYDGGQDNGRACKL